MAKKSSKQEVVDIEFDEPMMVEMLEKQPVKQPKDTQIRKNDKSKGLVSCLRNERVTVRHIPKETGMVTDPRHILYGGLAETARRTFVVPVLRNGAYVNILTDAEKEFLEDIMGLEYNALSIYKLLTYSSAIKARPIRTRLQTTNIEFFIRFAK